MTSFAGSLEPVPGDGTPPARTARTSIDPDFQSTFCERCSRQDHKDTGRNALRQPSAPHSFAALESGAAPVGRRAPGARAEWAAGSDVVVAALVVPPLLLVPLVVVL